VKFLKNFLDKHTSSIIKTKPLQGKVILSFEEPSLAESKPITSLDLTHVPLPEPQTSKERVIHPLEFPIKFEDYGNTSKHFWLKKPKTPPRFHHFDPPEEASPKVEPSKEWLMKEKCSSEAIQILSPSITMLCSLRDTIV
jgi:hypothetical protein